MKLNNSDLNQPSAAYVLASWAALAVGIASYLIGLWNSTFEFNEKGYYFAVFLLAMFAAVTLQKTIRDQEEGLPITKAFVGICWFAFASAIALLIIGLVNVDIQLSEKGFYGISFTLTLFSVVTVQKNTRDLISGQDEKEPTIFPTDSQEDHVSIDKDIID